MKKLILKSAALCMMLMCGAHANAQIDLGNVLSSVTSAASSSSSDLVSNITSIFSSSKQASSDNIVGTWSYTEPAIVFTSNNVLTKTAAKVAANKIESKVQSYLNTCGIKAGTMTMTFNEDGTFVEKLKGKTINGTWKVTNKQLYLTFTGMKAVGVTTQLDGSKLLFVTDATKMLTLMKGVAKASGNSTLSTVSSLMSGVKGMQVGLTMKKK